MHLTYSLTFSFLIPLILLQKRFQNDLLINNTSIDMFQDQQWVSVPWKKLQAGDIVRVSVFTKQSLQLYSLFCFRVCRVDGVLFNIEQSMQLSWLSSFVCGSHYQLLFCLYSDIRHLLLACYVKVIFCYFVIMLMAISHGPVSVFNYQLCIQQGSNHVLEASSLL